MTYRFTGRERVTIELDGQAEGLRVPAPLELDGGRVSLFAFFVEDLAITGVPLVRASYGELLWRIAVTDRGRPAWWIAACDIAARGPRIAARRWVRYPTRALKHLDIDDQRIACDGLSVRLGAPAGPQPVEVRPVLVGPSAEFEVPWGDDGAPGRAVPVSIDDGALAEFTVGGNVQWAATAAVRHGRLHRCGTARRR